MRLIMVTLMGVLGLPFAVLAQGETAYVVPSVPAPRDPLPRFTIAPRRGAPAPVGLPLPPIGLQPAPLAPNAPSAPNAPFAPMFAWPMMVFYVAQPVAAPAPAPEPAPKPVESPMPGRLVLDVEPSTAQVFADGYYVGVPEDFSATRGGGLIEAGLHRIDVSAAGYEPAAVDLRVISGQLVTYRAALKALPPPAPVPPTTFYLIPGCYMGNIPPKDAHLPATCDPTRAITWRP